MSQSLQLVETMIAAWEALDADGVVACFAEDGVWDNIPYAPITGKAAIATSVRNFLGDSVSCRFEVRHIGEISPGVVVTERVDVFQSKGGSEMRIPLMGIFEIKDGLIQQWRDYFDKAAMTPA